MGGAGGRGGGGRNGDGEEVAEGTGDLCAGERLRDQKDALGAPGGEGRVRFLRRVAHEDDREPRVPGLAPEGVEERLAHVERREVEDDGVRAGAGRELSDRGGEARRDDVEAAVPERERQELGDLGRVVDEEDARRPVHEALSAPASRSFGPAAGSRSKAQTLPPATYQARWSLSTSAPQASSVRIENV